MAVLRVVTEVPTACASSTAGPAGFSAIIGSRGMAAAFRAGGPGTSRSVLPVQTVFRPVASVAVIIRFVRGSSTVATMIERGGRRHFRGDVMGLGRRFAATLVGLFIARSAVVILVHIRITGATVGGSVCRPTTTAFRLGATRTGDPCPGGS